MNSFKTIDLFCGAGGSSWGARNAGAEIVAGFDIRESAGKAYRKNFPEARFFEGDLASMEPEALKRSLGDIDLLLASPECTSHSVAKGSAARSDSSRNTAFHVSRFAAALRPQCIIIENVVSMRSWHRYSAFLARLTKLGYRVREQTLNAAEFRVPQQRRRLFLLCRLDSMPEPVLPKPAAPISARDIIEPGSRYSFSALYDPKRAKGTLARAERAITALGPEEPFLLVYYGSDKAGGWQSLDKPLRTVTTLDRFALVTPTPQGHRMRMLQVPELKRAMGMPAAFDVTSESRRVQIQLIGNAVCPPVMRSIVSSILR